MNCREFLAEFEERSALTQTATLHLHDCPDCKKTSEQQTHVWQIIDAMKRVEAPNDFDFRVKARIASGKPTSFQPRFLPVLRYVLPLSLIVLVLGLVVFNTAYFSGGNAPQIVADNIQQAPAALEIPSGNSSLSEQVAAITNSQQPIKDEKVFVNSSNQSVKPAINEPKEERFVAIKYIKKQSAKSNKENPKDDFQGTSERAATFKEPLTPENITPNKTVENLPASDLKPLTDDQILDFIGIETISENGRKKVKSVKSESLAERSGVKVGDLIEAIDGKQINGVPARTGTVESKKITVTRGAEKIEIPLQNR